MKTGAWGEEMAALYLEKQGFQILARNFRCRAGEVDLIARESGTLVFVEVKTRRTAAYGLPCEAVTVEKQRHIQKVIRFYVMKNRLEAADLRIDVVEILFCKDTPCVRHTRNAF